MYYSQFKQDYFLNKVVLKGKRKGFFLDIGAHDGKTINNTYFFEKERGFQGICFEPNPKIFKVLKNNRSCPALNVCVGNSTGKVKFMCIEGYAEMLSGIIDSYDQRHLERIEKDIEVHGGTKEIIEVDVIRLDSLDELKNKVVDYCTIDTEGNELAVLEGIDFSLVKINVFTIENNYADSRVREFLETRGYALFYTSGDEIYIRKELIGSKMRSRLFIYRVINKIRWIFRKR